MSQCKYPVQSISNGRYIHSFSGWIFLSSLMKVQVGDLHTKQILIDHDWLLKDLKGLLQFFFNIAISWQHSVHSNWLIQSSKLCLNEKGFYINFVMSVRALTVEAL